MRIFVAGEGPDEIGDWAKDPAYLPSAPFGGVIESLLRRVCSDSWYIGGGCPWRRIRKYKAGRGLHDLEMRNVLGAALLAAEAGCDAIAFVRDRDQEVGREGAIEAGIERVRELNLIGKLIGGLAIEALDAWILALLGVSRSEQLTDPKQRLQADDAVNDAARKAEVAATADLNQIPSDADSLKRWLGRAAEVLTDS